MFFNQGSVTPGVEFNVDVKSFWCADRVDRYNGSKSFFPHVTSTFPGWKTAKFYKILYVTEHFLKHFGWFI